MALSTKITPTRAYRFVLEQLEEAIVSGKLKPGEKLPPERKLTESFGTSRRTLREAFRVLEQKGLIEIRMGSKGGAFVIDHMGERLSETLTLMIRRESVSHKDLAQFRAATEGTVTALAATQATPQDLKAIETGIEAIHGLVDQNPLDQHLFVEKELGLHQLLARACGNPIYLPIVRTVHTVLLHPVFLQDPIDAHYVRSALDDWRRLLDALQRKDAAGARKIMELHVKHFDEIDPRSTGK